MKLHRSAEDYLETILILQKQQGTVRSVDIARHLDFSKPSVSVAMKNLRLSGHIDMDNNGLITLLPPGREIAERIYELHCLLTEFLISLGVSRENASADACKIEHDLSDETFEKIMEYARKKRADQEN